MWEEKTIWVNFNSYVKQSHKVVMYKKKDKYQVGCYWTGDKQSCAPRPFQHQHRLHAPCLCARCPSASILCRKHSDWGFIFLSTPIGAPYIITNIEKQTRTSFNCSRYMEIRMLVLDSLKIISMNVLFRFFFILHADKGLVVDPLYILRSLFNAVKTTEQVGGKPNTRLAHGLYAMLRWSLQQNLVENQIFSALLSPLPSLWPGLGPSCLQK